MEQMFACLLACVLACLLAGANVRDGANVKDGAMGQVIMVILLENPYSQIIYST